MGSRNAKRHKSAPLEGHYSNRKQDCQFTKVFGVIVKPNGANRKEDQFLFRDANKNKRGYWDDHCENWIEK